MLKSLSRVNSRYEEIMDSDLSENQKSEQLANLMTEMEHEFKIPSLRDKEWEERNRAIIALYRKIAKSRN